MFQTPQLSLSGQTKRPKTPNRLLRTLSGDDLALLESHLEPVLLKRGDVLIEAGQPIAHVFFPEDSIGSVIGTAPTGRRIEVGLFGREGMSGTAVLLGSDRTPHQTLIQVPGSGLRIGTEELRRGIRKSPSLHEHLLRYVQAFHVQVSQTALSHGSDTTEQRLARWLLMCRDRLDSDDLPLIHEFLSLMLGVQRPGVTVAIQALEEGQMIRASRGLITITDRARLEEMAGGSYGVSEAECSRLFGAF